MTKTDSRSHSVRLSAALAAPPSIVPIGNDKLTPPHHAQVARVAGRVRVSPEVAGVIAFHAFGLSHRSDLAALHAVTAARVASHQEVR